jgi:hypothetical protein
MFVYMPIYITEIEGSASLGHEQCWTHITLGIQIWEDNWKRGGNCSF